MNLFGWHARRCVCRCGYGEATLRRSERRGRPREYDSVMNSSALPKNFRAQLRQEDSPSAAARSSIILSASACPPSGKGGRALTSAPCRRGVLYPYWENAARCVEDRCRCCTIAGAIAALILPAVTVLAGGALCRARKRPLRTTFCPRGRQRRWGGLSVRQRAGKAPRQGRQKKT